MERLAALFRSTDYRERGRKETAKLTIKNYPALLRVWLNPWTWKKTE
jgi:hypothetical protein